MRRFKDKNTGIIYVVSTNFADFENNPQYVEIKENAKPTTNNTNTEKPNEK